MGDDYFLLRVIGSLFAFSSLVSSDQLLVMGETGEILVTPSLQVKGSPGLNQDLTSLCERIHIRGFPRLQHIDKYAHALKLIVNASKTSNIHVCFHGNFSLAIGMCPQDRWEKISNGSWIKTISLFDHSIIDVRSASKTTLQVSTVQEWVLFRILCLVFGSVLLIWASTLSKSLAFYYSSVLIVGVIIVALLLLSQMVKHLQSGLSSWKLLLYTSLVPLTYFIFTYTSSRFQTILSLVGYKPGLEAAFLLVWLFNLYMMGLVLGIWDINTELLLSPDGSIDSSTSRFMSWSIWILAAILIFQSSIDSLLYVGALMMLIIMLPMLRRILLNLLLRILEGIRYVLGPTVMGYARDFLQHFKSMLKGIEPCNLHPQLNQNQPDCSSLNHILDIDTRLTTLLHELPIFFHGVTDGISKMKQSQDVFLQAIKNQQLQPNQDSNLQMFLTNHTYLPRNLDMDLTNFVTEFRTFSNRVNTNMLMMKQAQNALLRAISNDPKTLMPNGPPTN